MTNGEQMMVSPRGGASRWLIDFRSIVLDGQVLDDIAELFWEKLKHRVPFQVGGLETASIPIVAAVIMKAKSEGVHINGFYVRKSRKKDGLQRIIEGTLSDEKIVLLDDGINSGESFIRQLRLFEILGKQVEAISVIVRFRSESFYSYFRDRGIRVESIFTLDDFPKTGGVAAYEREAQLPKLTDRMPFTTHWKFESANPVFFHILPKSAPTLDDERVYFGADNGSMWALNQKDGSVAWRFKTFFGAGQKRIFSSPLISDGVLYFGAYDGNLYALDAKTGETKWVYRDADWIGSSPCISKKLGTIFVGLEFGLWKKEGGIAALDAKTGGKRWWKPIETLVHSSPVYSETHGVVVVGSSQGTVYAFDAKTGKPRWTHATGGAVRASFAIDENRGLVCFGSEDKNVYVLNIRNGKIIYRIETLEPVYSTPTVSDGKVYFGVLDKRVLCVNLDTGAVEWIFSTSSRIFSTPLLAEGHLYIGSNDGRLYELDPATGKETGFFQATERIVNKIAYNPTTKRFFVPTYANELYCLSRADQDAIHD